MEYIIDGYNLIKSSFLKKYDGHSDNRAVEELLQVVSGYRRKHPSVSFTVVFDGFIDMRFPDRKIRILFSHDETADEIIRKELERNHRANKAKTVVSNDREVQVCARINGGGVLGIDGFMEIVCPPIPRKIKGKESGKSPESINTLRIENELKNFYKKGT